MSQATLTDRPYVNSGLFSTHYLDERLSDTDEWDCDERARETMEELQSLYNLEGDLVSSYGEDALIDNWIDEVLDILGFGTQAEVTLPEADGYVDSLLFETPKKRREAAQVYLDTQDTTDLFERGIGLLEAKQWDADFTQRFSEQRPYYNASQQIKRYLGKTPANIQWGILTNGRKWRLYGTNEYEEQIYYEVDLPQLLEQGGVEEFKYFYLFFRPEALRESSGNSFLDEVWAESETASQELGEDLQDNVFTALRVLGRGFVESNDSLDIDPNDDEALDELKDQSLVLLYRLMFVLYAESRNLIHPDNPDAVDEYEANFSLNELRLDIHDQIGEVDEGFENEFSNYSTTMWSRIEDLSRLIDEGEEDLGIPPYNGGLFNSDSHTFLAKHEISNRYLAEVIYRLSTTQNEQGRYVLADYGDLDTRHLGSVYEGLLEHQFEIAGEDMAAVAEDGGQVWKPATEVSVADAVDEVPKNGLYVVNDQGERKATGAYYTPDYIVTYIIEETIAPLVEDIREDLVDQGFERGTQEYLGPFLRRITNLKVLDPAMGSGHFVTKATGYLSQEVMKEVREVETEMGVAFDEQHIRREIAKECIYGVDVNGMAVELAKLSMWLETLAADRPLAFLDHHLKAGNSIVGSDITDVLSEDNDQNDGQLTLTQAFARVRQDTLEHVMGLMSELLAVDNETLDDVKSMEELYAEIRSDPLYQRLFQLANVHTAEEFGLDTPDGAYEQMAGAIDDADEWTEVAGEDWFTAAQATAEEQEFFHWELEYPEVFFDNDGEKLETGGFDAVVGNPPYMRIQTIRLQNQDQVAYFNSIYESSHQNYDIYALFLEQGYNLTSTHGQVGYILPHKFMNAEFGEKLRQFLSDNRAIRKIVDFGHTQVFDQASTYTCLMFLSKTHNDQIRYTRSGTNVIQEDLVWSDINTDDLGADSWILLGPQEQEVINKITEPESLEELSDAVFVGIQTSKDTVYALELIDEYDDAVHVRSRETEDEYTLSKEMVVPYAKGEDVGRYAHLEPTQYLIFPYHTTDDGYSLMEPDEIQNRCPTTWEYLEENRSILEQRDGGSMQGEDWYGYTRPQSLHRHQNDKIITPEISDDCSFTLDTEGNHCTAMIYSVALEESSLDPHYVLGLLNSATTWYYVSNTSHVLRGGFYRFKSGYLRPIGVPQPQTDTPVGEEIASRVDALDVDADPEGATTGLISDLAAAQLETTKDRDLLSLDLQAHLNSNAPTMGSLGDIGLLQPIGDGESLLSKTATEYPNLRVGTAHIERDSPTTVTVEASARYKPDDVDAYETDQWGYTETDMLSAFRITDLTESEADLIEHFVPVAVEEAGGFANFRETATKTNSLIDRLKAMELPDVDHVGDDLENYLRTIERAEELEDRIKRTDTLIDELVYELYGLSDEEIEIVEGAVASE